MAERAATIAAALAPLPDADRRRVLGALDEISRPMTARELERALQVTRLSARDRKVIVAALRPFAILMLAED